MGSLVDQSQLTRVSAVFLDRDGVLCEDRGEPVGSWNEFRWLPGAVEGLRALTAARIPLYVVTNQAGVGRGIVAREQVEEVHRRLVREAEAAGARIGGVYACFHAPEEGCGCRKPMPGLLSEAARDHGIDLSLGWMIGNMRRDLAAGRAAGCRTVLVRTGKGREEEAVIDPRIIAPDLIAEDLVDAARRIVSER